jgi:hypothetical protein
MSQWYVSKSGKALGPFSENEMIEKIQKKELNPLDLVYKMGLPEWQTLNQMEELKSHFKVEEALPKNRKSSIAEWVVLKKTKSEKGSEFKQLGPFTEEQILELIDHGEVRFSDFAWRNGLETWVKISQLDPFSKPLPSSSQVDLTIYETTSIEIETVTDHEKRSLTNMVKIEKFDHNIKDQTKVSTGYPLSEDFATQTDNELKLSSITESQKSSSLSNKSFSESGEGVNLWSLELPDNNKLKNSKESELDENEDDYGGNDEDYDKTVVATPKKLLDKQIVKEHSEKPELVNNKIKGKSKKESKKAKPISPNNTQEVKLWIVACSVFIMAATVLYLSLNPSRTEIAYEEPQIMVPISQIQNNIEAPVIANDEVYKKMEKLKESIKEARNLHKESNESSELKASPKVPIEQKQSLKKVIAKKVEVKTISIKPIAKTKSDEKQLKISKKTTKPEKPVINKIVQSKPKIIDNLVKGSAKAKSFYVQRDRKALFYSSLKAETLAVEIQKQFAKLNKNKKEWKKFYGQWKKKVNSAIASDIRNYPLRSEKYAFPKTIENFKKDYELFYKYGEAFNAKVNGTRLPSGVPTDMQKIFLQHKMQAQGLGN